MPTPTSYKLNIRFDQSDLENLYITGSKVIVAKPIQGAEPSIAWVVFQPSETNVMSWVEEHGIYASTVSPENGAVLTHMSQTELPALAAKTYQVTFDGSTTTISLAYEAGRFVPS